MIISISTIDLYTVLNWLSDITDLTKIYNWIPIDWEEVKTPYIFLSKVSDVAQVTSNEWYVEKVARISVTIVWSTWWDDQENIENIRDTITDEIVNESCVKIAEVWSAIINDIQEMSDSPLFYNEKKRQYMVKDYLFTYRSNV